MLISTQSGKTIDTATLRQCVQPANCCECGQRVGWHHDGLNADTPVLWCDDCAADEVENDDTCGG